MMLYGQLRYNILHSNNIITITNSDNVHSISNDVYNRYYNT